MNFRICNCLIILAALTGCGETEQVADAELANVELVDANKDTTKLIEGGKDAPSKGVVYPVEDYGLTIVARPGKVIKGDAFSDMLGPDLQGTSRGEKQTLLFYEIGTVDLPTNVVRVCGGYSLGGQELNLPFTPGKFPVAVSVVANQEIADERVAFARVLFGEGLVEKWTRVARVPVGCGSTAFSSPGAFARVKKYYKEEDGFNVVISLCFKNSYKYTRDWAQIDTDAGSFVRFSSGEGDGSYDCYAGYDSEGALMALVYDFGLVDWDVILD